MSVQHIAVCIVIERERHLLFVQEGKPHIYGLWNIPTGHVEVGESILSAATREAKEETGLDVALTGLLGVENYCVDDGSQYVKFIFLGEVTKGIVAVDGKEIIAAQWFSEEQISAMQAQLRKPQTVAAVLTWLKQGKTYPIDLIRDYLQ